jgi:hypothetical protein
MPESTLPGNRIGDQMFTVEELIEFPLLRYSWYSARP